MNLITTKAKAFRWNIFVIHSSNLFFFLFLKTWTRLLHLVNFQARTKCHYFCIFPNFFHVHKEKVAFHCHPLARRIYIYIYMSVSNTNSCLLAFFFVVMTLFQVKNLRVIRYNMIYITHVFVTQKLITQLGWFFFTK